MEEVSMSVSAVDKGTVTHPSKIAGSAKTQAMLSDSFNFIHSK